MGRFIKGDVVVLPFPFSDLTANKKRPALVVANLTGGPNCLFNHERTWKLAKMAFKTVFNTNK